MARFLLFSLLGCTQDGGEEENKKKGHARGGGGEHKNVDCYVDQHTKHNKDHYMVYHHLSF